MPTTTQFPEPITVTIAEAIRLTGKCETRIRQMIRNGEVETRKNGKRTLIVYTSLRRRILEQR